VENSRGPKPFGGYLENNRLDVSIDLNFGNLVIDIEIRNLRDNFLPMDPRMELCKILHGKPLHSSMHTARASPITNCAVVLEVGARLFRPASLFTVASRIKSAFLARYESLLPTIAMRTLP